MSAITLELSIRFLCCYYSYARADCKSFHKTLKGGGVREKQLQNQKYLCVILINLFLKIQDNDQNVQHH